jgi:hypothetical protein
MVSASSSSTLTPPPSPSLPSKVDLHVVDPMPVYLIGPGFKLFPCNLSMPASPSMGKNQSEHPIADQAGFFWTLEAPSAYSLPPGLSLPHGSEFRLQLQMLFGSKRLCPCGMTAMEEVERFYQGRNEDWGHDSDFVLFDDGGEDCFDGSEQTLFCEMRPGGEVQGEKPDW